LNIARADYRGIALPRSSTVPQPFALPISRRLRFMSNVLEMQRFSVSSSRLRRWSEASGGGGSVRDWRICGLAMDRSVVSSGANALHASELDRPEGQVRRKVFASAQRLIRAVSFSLTGPGPRPTWRHAQAVSGGKRLMARVTVRPLEDATSVAAVGWDGVTAPVLLFDGPIKARSFTPMSSRFLAPTLKPGDIMVLDNRHDPELDHMGSDRIRGLGPLMDGEIPRPVQDQHRAGPASRWRFAFNRNKPHRRPGRSLPHPSFRA
jgi:hypothetical protein